MPSEAGRFSFEGLDRAIHEKARLGILTSLSGHPDGVAFSDLKRLCDLTDGNLNRHLAVLEEAELVALSKEGGRRPGTVCRLTPLGRRRFADYLDVLERLVRDARQETRRSVGQADERQVSAPGRLSRA